MSQKPNSFSSSCPLIGAPFVQVKPGLLVEKGDHVLNEAGIFVAVSLADIGKPVPDAAVVRRLAPRPPAY